MVFFKYLFLLPSGFSSDKNDGMSEPEEERSQYYPTIEMAIFLYG